jgi:hypothetical protein
MLHNNTSSIIDKGKYILLHDYTVMSFVARSLDGSRKKMDFEEGKSDIIFLWMLSGM